MAKSNSQNIKVFPEWFDIDLDSFEREIMLCGKLFALIENNKWEWNSDKNGFWIEERSGYFRQHSSNDKIVNFQIVLKEIPGLDVEINSIDPVPVGRVIGADAKRFSKGAIHPHLLKQARQDVLDNPIQEQGFDWDVLRESL